MPFAGYKDFDACVRQNSNKKDPKAYCATIMKQTEILNTNKDWHVLEYFVPVNYIQETAGNTDEFHVEGTAIEQCVSRNGVKYLAEELLPATETLKGKPLLLDHRNETMAIVGRVKNAFYENQTNKVKFKAQIMEPKIKEMIKDGRIQNVSVGARVKNLREEENEGDKYVVAEGIEFLELSLTPVPGVAGATITQALSESYNIKKSQEAKIMEEKEMMECPTCKAKMGSKPELDKHMQEKHPKKESLSQENSKQKEENKMEEKQVTDSLLATTLQMMQEQLLALKKEVSEAKESRKEETSKPVPKGTVATQEIVAQTESQSQNDLVVERTGRGVSIYKKIDYSQYKNKLKTV